MLLLNVDFGHLEEVLSVLGGVRGHCPIGRPLHLSESPPGKA